MISALFSRVSITCAGLERLLLETLRVVELRHTWILTHAGQTVGRGNVRKTGLLQGTHGRRCVDGVNLPAHVEAGRRAVAEVLTLWPLVGTRVFKHLRGVVMIFPVHGCRGPRVAGRLRAHAPTSRTFCATPPCGATASLLRAPHRCVTLSPCDSAALRALVSLFAQKQSRPLRDIVHTVGFFFSVNGSARPSVRKSVPLCKYRNV